MQEVQNNINSADSKEHSTPRFMPLKWDFLDDFEIAGDIEAGQAIKASIRYFKSVVSGSPKDDILESVESVPAKMIVSHLMPNFDRALKDYFTKSANGKKGGAPKGNQNARKKKKPQPEPAEDLSEDEKPLILSSDIENCVCSLLIQDYDEDSPIHKLKNKAQAIVAVGHAAAYMSVCENSDYDIIFEVDNKNALDIIAELRDSDREAFNGDETSMQKAFEQARDYAKKVMRVSKDNLLSACKEYEDKNKT